MIPVAWLQLRMILGQRKVWLVLAFVSLPVLLSLLVRGSGGFQTSEIDLTGVYLFLVYPQATTVLLALMYGSSLLGVELEGKTLTYLFTRPVPKWRIIAGKYAAIAFTLCVFSSASLAASWLILGGVGGPTYLFAFLLANAGGIFAYTAIFTLLGMIIPKRAMALGIIYVVLFEGMLSFVPALVNTITVTYYLRSILVGMLDVSIPAETARIVGGASLGLSAAVLLAMITISLALSALIASNREYVVTEQP